MTRANQDEALTTELRRTYFIQSVDLDTSATAQMPAKRGGATLTEIQGTGVVYLIGGANRMGTSFGDVFRFDLDTRTWTFVKPSRGSLSPRSGHSAVAIGSKIYVFGGLNLAEKKIYNDVHIFDTRTSSWTKATTKGDDPLPRNAHAALVLPQTDELAKTRQMLVYGGSSPEYGTSSDVDLLSIPINDSSDEAKTLQWKKLRPGGEIPEARELHCVFWQSDHTICFAGGRTVDGQLCTDLALLNSSNWTWQLVPVREWNRCAFTVGVVDGAIISYGGWDGGAIRGDCSRYCDLEKSWTAVLKTSMSNKEPLSLIPERFGHCGTCVRLPPLVNDSAKTWREALMVFGGMNAEEDLNDLVLICLAMT